MQETTQPKVTGIDLINSTLNRGSTGPQVKALQQYLNGLGYDVGKIDEVYGPKVEAAVKQYQLDNGLTSDGVFGSKSLGKAKTIGSTNAIAGAPGTGKAPNDPSNMYDTSTGKLNPNFKPTTQSELDQYYNATAASHPVFSGNSPEALKYAQDTGDFSNLINSDGKPFSQVDEEAAMAKAKEALAPGFNATKEYDTANAEDVLKNKNSEYSNFLNTEKTNFQKDKTNLDQTAADNGVLFSGGRAQKEQALKNTYDTSMATKAASIGTDISGTARDYQYKYGNDAAKAPTLSQYYQMTPGNVYNPGVARGGVTPGALSSVYNADKYNFQGTNVNANKASTAVRAAALLANKGNKLVGTGYNNQL